MNEKQAEKAKSTVRVSMPVSDADLLEAIALRVSECFNAMNIANALSGRTTVPWTIVREYSLPELVTDALDRGLDLRALKAAVDHKPFCETKLFEKLDVDLRQRVSEFNHNE